MEAHLANLSHIWETGGAGGTGGALVHSIARALCQGYRGVASVLRGDEQQWAFFIMSADARHCKQLHGAPKDVAWAPSAPAGGKGAVEVFNKDAPGVLFNEQQWSFSKGTDAAGFIAHYGTKHFATLPVSIMNLTVVVEHAGGDSEKASIGALHFCMWRKDVIEAVQAQFGLSDAAGVPSKVWRRLGRAGLSPTPGNASGRLTGFDVAGLLVCWECGAMPAELQQCSRCSIACYCSRECQRANYSSRHRRWCKGLAGKLAENEDAPCPSAAYTTYLEDLEAAVLRHPQASALTIVTPGDRFVRQLSRAMADLRVGGGAASSSNHT